MRYSKTTRHGCIRFCNGCNLYHLEFGNICLNLSERELEIFREYVNGIDADYWCNRNRQTENNRKILLSTQLKGTCFCFHASEFEEFKCLLNPETPLVESVDFHEINYEFSLN